MSIDQNTKRLFIMNEIIRCKISDFIEKSVMAQIEYRQHLFWRLGFAVFAATGEVAENVGDLRSKGLKFAVGGGLL